MKLIVIKAVKKEARGNTLLEFGTLEVPDGTPIETTDFMIADSNHTRGIEAVMEKIAPKKVSDEGGGETEGSSAAPKAANPNPRKVMAGALPVTSGHREGE